MLDRVPKKQQGTAKERLKEVAYALTKEEAGAKKQQFEALCQVKGYSDAGKLLNEDWDRMVPFFGFPQEPWTHLRTTNAIESPFATVRLRTDAAKRYQKVENGTAAVWKLLMVAEQRFQKTHQRELLEEVLSGTRYVNGVPVPTAEEQASAA